MQLSVLDRILAAELQARRREVAAIDPRLLPQVDRLIAFTLKGGKRLRPQFLWWGWRAAGGAPDGDAVHAVIQAAASLELIQASALMHDDIIDHSDTRRGEPSLHRVAAKAHADEGLAGDSDDYGLSTAILLGDLALVWADDLFIEAASAIGDLTAALPAWRGMRTEVLSGQLLDLRVAVEVGVDPQAQIRDAMAVNRHKTAAYTVERPLHLGAALANAADPIVAALRAYGADIGIAFQLRDDLLGVFGDASVTGKPAGDDLVEGKQTALLATARARLRPDLLAELDDGIGRVGSPAQVARLADLIAGSGAVAAMEEQIAALVTAGLTALDEPLLDSEAVTALRELAVLATSRVS